MKAQRRIKLLFLLGCLIAAGYVLVECQRFEEPKIIHRIYLPMVVKVTIALKGVGQSAPVCADVGAVSASWYYNWYAHPTKGCDTDRFVPMIYGIDLSALSTAVHYAELGDGWILGFNEPDLNGVSVVEGAVAWRQIEEQNVNLVSPAPSQHNPDWLWQMVDEYQHRYGTRPRFDAIAAHIYTNDPQIAKDYLIARHNEALRYGYDVPVWVTEWGGLCTLPDPQNGNLTMMQEMIPWMRRQGWIARYAWFASRISENEPWGSGWQHCSLIDAATGKLTNLGKTYRGSE